MHRCARTAISSLAVPCEWGVLPCPACWRVGPRVFGRGSIAALRCLRPAKNTAGSLSRTSSDNKQNKQTKNKKGGGGGQRSTRFGAAPRKETSGLFPGGGGEEEEPLLPPSIIRSLPPPLLSQHSPTLAYSTQQRTQPSLEWALVVGRRTRHTRRCRRCRRHNHRRPRTPQRAPVSYPRGRAHGMRAAIGVQKEKNQGTTVTTKGHVRREEPSAGRLVERNRASMCGVWKG